MACDDGHFRHDGPRRLRARRRCSPRRRQLVAVWGTQTGANPTHSRSLLYFVVSLEPWPFYACARRHRSGSRRARSMARRPRAIRRAHARNRRPRRCGSSPASPVPSEPSRLAEAWRSRWWPQCSSSGGGGSLRAAERRHPMPGDERSASSSRSRSPSWSRWWSRAFNRSASGREASRRSAPRSTERRVSCTALDVLPPQRRDVLWGWTASSLSLVVRTSPDAGVLVDRDPAYVPFPAEDAREQLADEYVWASSRSAAVLASCLRARPGALRRNETPPDDSPSDTRRTPSRRPCGRGVVDPRERRRSRAPFRGSSSRSSRRRTSGTTTAIPRGNGRHAGIDMENPWRAPVVAVEDGEVKYWESGLGGCMLYHYGRSGTTYLYIHLNNDLTPRNDNKGGCERDVAFAVPNGAKVTAGQQIAWNGDSGDASGNPHLHFEVHPERRGGREPVQTPEAREQAALRRAEGSRLQPRSSRRPRRRGRGRGDARGRSRPPVPGRPLARDRPS